MIKKILFSKIAILTVCILVIVLTAFSLVYATWQSPSSTPPGSDTSTPVNIGSNTQIKLGDIGVHGVPYVWPSAQGGANTFLKNGADGTLGNLSWSTITNDLPTGTSGQTLRNNGGGVANWVANSLLYNNGTNIGINTTSPFPSVVLDINGAIKIADGTQGLGKVLVTKDATGLAQWGSCPGSVGPNGIQGNICYLPNPEITCNKNGKTYSPGYVCLTSCSSLSVAGKGYSCSYNVCQTNGTWTTGGDYFPNDFVYNCF